MTQYSSSDEDVEIHESPKRQYTPRNQPNRERKQRVQLTNDDDDIDYDASNKPDPNYNSNDVSETESDDDDRKPKAKHNKRNKIVSKEKINEKKQQQHDESSDDESFLKHHNNIINKKYTEHNTNKEQVQNNNMIINSTIVGKNNNLDNNNTVKTTTITDATYTTPTKQQKSNTINIANEEEQLTKSQARKRLMVESTKSSSESENESKNEEEKSSDDDVPLSKIKTKYNSPSSFKQSIIGDSGQLIKSKTKVEHHKKPIQRRKKIVKTGCTQTMTQCYGRGKKTNKYKNIISKHNKKLENQFDIPAYNGGPTNEILTPNPDFGDDEPDMLTEIVNVRKGTGYKLELMGKYNNGQILWFYIHPAWKEFTKFIDNFMKSIGIGHEICGYKNNPRKGYRHMTNHDDFGTERDLDFNAITKRIHKKLKHNKIKNITKNRTEEEVDTTTNTTNEEVDTTTNTTNVAVVEIMDNDEKSEEDYVGRGLEQRDNLAWRESKNDYDDSGFYK